MRRFFLKFLTRINAFQTKELVEILRQPKLILTLVIGPFIIMLLFGLAYPDQARALRTMFVVSGTNSYQAQIDRFAQAFPSTIKGYVIEKNKDKALAELAAGRTDLVIIVPDVPDKTIENNQQAEFVVYHNEIDPFQVGYVQSVAQVYVDEFNREVVKSEIEQEQKDSGSLQTNLQTAITKMQALRKAIPATDQNSASQAADLEKDLTDINTKLSAFRSVSSGIMIAPFTAKVSGLLKFDLTVPAFFAPAVLVLLMQHISVTFASLSIVRERRSGIMELFKVAPITAFETLVGKYLSYLLFEIILAAIMTALAIWLLKIPIFEHFPDYVFAMVALIFTSLGLGFLISLISDTDTQAVEYSMLLLLASIFFSGFFLDLRLLKEPITVLTWLLPSTYGIQMLQDIMLRGYPVPALILAGLTLIGIVMFFIDWIILRRKMES